MCLMYDLEEGSLSLVLVLLMKGPLLSLSLPLLFDLSRDEGKQ